MFIYDIGLVDYLKRTAKNREYVMGNPALCKLLENPYTKDDTELAIRYNEYRLSYPNAAQEFVDYFYTHGPELDIGTLDEWRSTILNDPVLNDVANQNNTQIELLWQAKKNDSDSYKWLGDLFDCLSQPCQYTKAISPSLGGMANSRNKYNLKNTVGSDQNNTLTSVPSYMLNKMPKIFSESIMGIVDLISSQCQDVYNVAMRKERSNTADAYTIKNAELISGDLFVDISMALGDCFRLYEQRTRYNPYDYQQNQKRADALGTVVYDAKGKAHISTPMGNKSSHAQRQSQFSDNSRLDVNYKSGTISSNNKNGSSSSSSSGTISPLINSGATRKGASRTHITCYGGVVTPDGKYYEDPTKDSGTAQGATCNCPGSGIFIIPCSYSYIDSLRTSGRTIHANIAATTKERAAATVQKRVQELHGVDKLIDPDKLTELCRKAIKDGELYATLFFPAKTITLRCADVGGGPGSEAGKNNPEDLWIDITNQFFLTEEGKTVATPWTSDGPIEFSGTMPLTFPASDIPTITNAAAGTIRTLKINGDSSLIIDGFVYFSENFCSTNGLDYSIYGPSSSSTIVHQLTHR